jgi:glycosyltransferase involved in cell wall biosynthesis
MWPPYHNSGAEFYAHHLAKYLQSQGHEIRVLIRHNDRIPKQFTHEGIEVMQLPLGSIEGAFNWGDCFFTHLDQTRLTAIMGRKLNKHVFWMCHNTFPYEEPRLFPSTFHTIYNNEATAEKCGYTNKSFTLPPPVDFRHYAVTTKPESNEFITLVNLNENKGGKFLTELAKAMPHKRFLGVTGSYEEQYTKQPDNVEIWPQMSDIRPAYAQTRLLIVPSIYESWSMCATEAMCNGIPVIASPTFGLKLNVQDAGLYCEPRDLKAWVKAIEMMDDPKTYDKYSKKAKKRAKELDPLKVLPDFYQWFLSIVQ